MLDVDRLRELSTVELSSPPALGDIRRRAARRRQRRWAAIAAALVLIAVPATLQVLGQERDVQVATEIPMRLASIPEGVSTLRVAELPLFLIRDGSSVVALVARSNHLQGERLWWCRDERVFISPAHGEVWALDGSTLHGPPPRGLDRIDVRVIGDAVTFDTTSVRPGPPVPSGLPPSPVGPGYCDDYLAAPDDEKDYPALFVGPLPVLDDVNVAFIPSRSCAKVRPSLTDVAVEKHFTLDGCAPDVETGLHIAAFRPATSDLPWVAILRVPIGTVSVEPRRDSQSVSSARALLRDPSSNWMLVTGTSDAFTELAAVDRSLRTLATAEVPEF